MIEKRCNKCKMVKPIGSFHIRKKSPDGHATTCKVCASEYMKRYNAGLVELKHQVPGMGYGERYKPNAPSLCNSCPFLDDCKSLVNTLSPLVCQPDHPQYGEWQGMKVAIHSGVMRAIAQGAQA